MWHLREVIRLISVSIKNYLLTGFGIKSFDFLQRFSKSAFSSNGFSMIVPPSRQGESASQFLITATSDWTIF